MGMVDLINLTEKKISKDKEARKDSLIYKGNISITEEDYKKLHDEIYSVIDKWVESLLQ